MRTRQFALIAGVAYLLIGILGFLPPLLSSPPSGAPYVPFDYGYGYLLGLFPINVLHNIVHLAIGTWGITAYNDFILARLFSRFVAVFYALLAIMGLIPGANTTFGFIPLFSNNIWLHTLTALIAAYFGFIAPEPTKESEVTSVSKRVEEARRS